MMNNIDFPPNKLLNSLKLYRILKNRIWVVVNWIDGEKFSLIFKNRSILMVLDNGKVSNYTWEYLGNDLIILNTKDGKLIFKIELKTSSIIVLRGDFIDSPVFLVDDLVYKKGIETYSEVVQFLTSTYLPPQVSTKYIFDIIPQIKSTLKAHNKKRLKRKEDIILIIITGLIIVTFIIGLIVAENS